MGPHPEKATGMTRTQVLVRGAALSGGSIFVSMAAMLLVGKIFTNVLDTASVGVFALLLLGADLLNLAGNLGLPAAMPKLIAAAPAEKQPRIVASALAFQGALCAALSVVLYLVWRTVPGEELLRAKPDWLTLWPYLWLLPPLFITGIFRDTIMAVLAGFNRYGARASGIIVSSLAQVALAYVALWRWHGGVITLTLTTVASYALSVALMAAALPGSVRPRFEWPAYRESVCFSWPLYMNQLLTFCYQRIDTFLVASFLGVSSAAIYEMIKRLPTLLSRVLGAFLVPYLPNVSELIASGDREGAARLLDRGVRITAFVGYGAALCVLAIQEPLVRLLFNADYLQGLPVLGLLLTATCLTVQTGIMGQTLIALGRPRTMTVINIGLAGAGLLGNMLLLPHFGLVGGGYAAMGAIIFSGGLQAFYVHRNGLPVSLGACLKPQAVMLLALAAGLWGGFAGRLLGVFLFVTLSLAWAVVRFDELLRLAQALGLRFRAKG